MISWLMNNKLWRFGNVAVVVWSGPSLAWKNWGIPWDISVRITGEPVKSLFILRRYVEDVVNIHNPVLIIFKILLSFSYFQPAIYKFQMFSYSFHFHCY
jgi:hypothetical protein